VLFAVNILGDSLTARIVIGGLLTLGGVGLISLREARIRARKKALIEP
jgi:drug/metabolite transporter (DMT)-like permease